MAPDTTLISGYQKSGPSKQFKIEEPKGLNEMSQNTMDSPVIVSRMSTSSWEWLGHSRGKR